MRNFQVLFVVVATMLPGLVFCQGAADYPVKTVRVIVASTPGGGADVQARLYTPKLSENLRRQFVVENREGGGDLIGIEYVAKSAADGYTLLAVSPTFTILPALQPSFPFDPVKDFAPISLVTRAPYLLLVHPSLPVKSVQELIALAKAKPGALDWGVGYGTSLHLAAVYFASAANVKITLIFYKGIGQAYIDANGGHVPLIMGNVLSGLPHVRAGRLRVLAVTSAQRAAALPEVPTISESGVPGYDVTTWHGWLAPAGTPAALVNKLSSELARAVKSADIIKKIALDGAEAVGSSPEQFQQVIAAEAPRWRKIVKDANIHQN